MTAHAVSSPVSPGASAHLPAAIEVANLTKIFGGVRAVDDLSFTAAHGEIVGFLGPNGAGKTTTMRILTGYTPATSGRASIAGHDVRRDSFRARAKVGYLPEHAPLYATMKVRPFLRFMAEIKRCPRPKIAAQVDRMIEECGLSEVAGRLIGHLSRGYRQRVGIAQALLNDPAVLILDEPTVGLDPRQIAEIRRMIRDMAGRRTVLLSTHILSEVAMTCRKAIVINRGRIVAEGAPERLTLRGGSERTSVAPIFATVTGDPERIERALAGVPGVERVEIDQRFPEGRTRFAVRPSPGDDPSGRLSRAAVEAGFELTELHAPGVSLEDVFLHAISDSRGV